MGTVRMGSEGRNIELRLQGRTCTWDSAAQEAHQRCCTLNRDLKQGTDDCGRSEGAFTMLKGSTEPGIWRSGFWSTEEGLCAGQEPSGVAGGAENCAARVLPCSESVWSASYLWGPWQGAVGSGVKSVQNGRHALPRGRGSLSWVDSRGEDHAGALVCTCTCPWPHQSGPHRCCPAAQHSLISLGARSHCADALFPAPNSQPPALTTAFLGQLREGQSSQDCLTCSVNVTLPWALLPAGSWPWMHHH